MRRSFTIAMMLGALFAAGVQAQTNLSGPGGKTLTDLEAQSKAKKKATAPASGDATSQSSGQAGDQPTTTSTTKKTTAAKPKTTAKRTVVRRPATTTAAKKPAPAPAPAPAATDTAQPGATAGPAPMVAQPASGAQTQPAQQPQAAPADEGQPKIYKSGTLPDAYKFQQEKSKDKKPVSEGAGANAAPAAAPASESEAAPAAAAEAPAKASTAAGVAAPTDTPHPDPLPADAGRGSENKNPASAQASASGQKRAAGQTPAADPGQGKGKPAPVRAASKGSAPGAHAWRDRGYISGNVGWQASSATFADTRTLTVTTGDTEPRHLTASYEIKAGPMFDIGAGIRLVKNLGVGVAVTRFSLSNDININASVPHPFFFNTQRALSGTTPGTREELAVHLDAVYVVPGRKVQVAIFGGPTFFNAKQTVVSDFTYGDTYPFDNPPTFTAAVSAQESKTVTGFNVGADIGYYFTDIFGVGGVIRFSRGTFASSIGDLDLGGPQLSAGVRIRFRQGKGASAKPPAPAKPAEKKDEKKDPKKK